MPKRGKKYRAAAEKVQHGHQYSISEAVALAKEVAFAKFEESLNVDIRLGVDPRKADQQVRGTVALPHGTGRTVRVAVFAEGDDVEAAKSAGAEHVGSQDLVDLIKGGMTDFDVSIATPAMMRFVGQVGRILGPRGLMPNPKAGTVTTDVKGAVEAAKAGRVEFRLDKTAIIHSAVGRLGFEVGQLEENVQAFLDAIVRAKPAAAKGHYIKSMYVSSTMGPGIAVQVTV